MEFDLKTLTDIAQLISSVYGALLIVVGVVIKIVLLVADRCGKIDSPRAERVGKRFFRIGAGLVQCQRVLNSSLPTSFVKKKFVPRVRPRSDT